MSKHLHRPGFSPPTDRALGCERQTVTLAELVTTIGLTVCTLIAVTAVSVGIARADAGTIIDNEGGLFAIALVLGLVFVLMGGLSVLTLPGHRPRKH